MKKLLLAIAIISQLIGTVRADTSKPENQRFQIVSLKNIPVEEKGESGTMDLVILLDTQTGITRPLVVDSASDVYWGSPLKIKVLLQEKQNKKP